MNYYSNGKLLLTGEYLVLDGAKSLALPTKFGQDVVVEKIKESQLIWGSFTHSGECWFEAVFDLPKLRLVNCPFKSNKEGSAEVIAETLLSILQEAKRANPNFLNSEHGFVVKTNLTFPRNWGLGSSSTLINSIASWAKVDAFALLKNSFGGSGYDIACAQNDTPVLYEIKNTKPIVESVSFNPEFIDDIGKTEYICQGICIEPSFSELVYLKFQSVVHDSAISRKIENFVRLINFITLQRIAHY